MSIIFQYILRIDRLWEATLCHDVDSKARYCGTMQQYIHTVASYQVVIPPSFGRPMLLSLDSRCLVYGIVGPCSSLGFSFELLDALHCRQMLYS